MIWPHPLDVIQYARSSYYYNNVYFSYTLHPTGRVRELIAFYVDLVRVSLRPCGCTFIFRIKFRLYFYPSILTYILGAQKSMSPREGSFEYP